MGRIIDLHFHYPFINPLLHSPGDMHLNILRKMLFGVAFRYYCRVLKVPYTKDLELLSARIRRRVVEVIDGSGADHVVALAFDGVYDSRGKMMLEKSLLHVPNESVYRLAESHEKVLAGASINPLRKDAFEELERAAENNAALIKMHPCYQLYDARLPRFRPFYRRAAELGLPLLVHVGFESAVPGMETRRRFTKPDQVEPMLEEGCRVIMAHGGGNAFLAEREKRWFSEVLGMLGRYPRLYLDNSATVRLHSKARAFSLLRNRTALGRTAFGTDFPVIPAAGVFLMRLGLARIRELTAIRNPVDRDIALKRALGFPEETFSRGYGLVNRKALG